MPTKVQIEDANKIICRVKSFTQFESYVSRLSNPSKLQAYLVNLNILQVKYDGYKQWIELIRHRLQLLRGQSPEKFHRKFPTKKVYRKERNGNRI